jgi:hypothetical protein
MILTAQPRMSRTNIPLAIWIADAHCDDGKRFVVRADEKLTAFVELQSAVRGSRTYPHLQELETQAKAARRGAWGKSQP